MMYLLQSRAQKDRHGHYLGKYKWSTSKEQNNNNRRTKT